VEILGSYRRVLGEEIAGMKALLLDLKRRGVRVAGLSDTNPVHLEALSGYAVVRELELLLASCITGRAKPHLDTFQHALAALGVAADEVFFTDDLEVNVEGARRAGIRAEVFRGVEDLRRTLGV
jgi:putative hydrolase of the HAD superfamily